MNFIKHVILATGLSLIAQAAAETAGCQLRHGNK
jgi:hypothetical protein